MKGTRFKMVYDVVTLTIFFECTQHLFPHFNDGPQTEHRLQEQMIPRIQLYPYKYRISVSYMDQSS